MSTSIFTKTPRLQHAVQLINSLPNPKFPLLLSRIVQKFHLKNEESFSQEEEEKLQASLSLNAEDVKLLLQTLSFFFEQAAYHLCKPQVLQQNLALIDVSEEKVEAIVQAWSSQARIVTEELRQSSLAPAQLKDLSWELRVQLAQSSISKQKQPVGVLQLQLDGQPKKENLSLQFTQEQLFRFYTQLETIQSQLDALG